jgi:hypothetical protein
VGLKSLKSLNLTNGYPNKNKKKKNNNKNNNKVKSKPLELFELAGKNKEAKALLVSCGMVVFTTYLLITGKCGHYSTHRSEIYIISPTLLSCHFLKYSHYQIPNHKWLIILNLVCKIQKPFPAML